MSDMGAMLSSMQASATAAPQCRPLCCVPSLDGFGLLSKNPHAMVDSKIPSFFSGYNGPLSGLRSLSAHFVSKDQYLQQMYGQAEIGGSPISAAPVEAGEFVGRAPATPAPSGGGSGGGIEVG